MQSKFRQTFSAATCGIALGAIRTAESWICCVLKQNTLISSKIKWILLIECSSKNIRNLIVVDQFFVSTFRYVSSHHNRSQSVRTPGSKSNVQVGINGTSRYRPNYLCLPQQRTRVASMPNTGVEEEYYRLRQFSISGKGIINRGDSLKSRRSRSNTSVASSNSSHRYVEP